jgi:eukaryotic-like serine/threonine-protein kinase
MSAAGKGGGPPTTLKGTPSPSEQHTQVDVATEVGLAHTIASTGELVISAQLPPSGSGAVAALLPHQPSDLMPGTMVGEYRIEGKLGEGGMGQVFAAIHPVIGKRAAIKVIKLELCANAEAVERFVQEARAVNQIGHANIVDVFAFGTLPDGRRYLVMEWLRGESLSARLKREKLSVEEVCDILDPICRALEGAHEKRIIHRDLKPDNVFLCAVKGDKPVVKLLDFGIAKLAGTEDTRLERTRTGSMLGTPAYISPEQARGRGVDERTDIYALGAMAFEMFTGRPPFDADNAMDMISSHLHDPAPAPCSVVPGLPPALDTLLLGMLEKDPGNRPSLQRVRDSLADIRRAPMASRATVRAAPPLVDNGAPIPAERPRAVSVETTAKVERGGKGKWIALAVVIAAGAAAAVIVGGGRASKPAPPPPAAAVEPSKPAPVVEAPAPTPAPAPVVAPRPAQLSIAVNVPDATIEVGGKTVKAENGRAQVSLPPGEYELSVSAPGRKPASKQLTLAEGATVAEKIHLERGKSAARPSAGSKPTTKPTPPADKPKEPGKKPPGDDDTIW